MSALLELADWRRRVAELYAEVREIAARDPLAAWERWREARDRLFREHPQSPVPQETRLAFRPQYFAYDPSLRVEANVLATEEPAHENRVPMSSGDQIPLRRIGAVEVLTPYGSGTLALYWIEEYAGGLFLAFRDGTSGAETYGGGRYLLDTAKGADLGGNPAAGTIVLDFNFAYHPSCVYDGRWSCPLAPAENTLGFAVRAGERLPGE